MTTLALDKINQLRGNPSNNVYIFICVFTFSTAIYDYIGIYVERCFLKIGGSGDIEIHCQG